MHKAGNKYFTNFPKYDLSLTISFSKNQYLNNSNYFKEFDKIIKKYKCDIYVTKDEILLENYKKTVLKKLSDNFSYSHFKASNIFKEKLLIK